MVSVRQSDAFGLAFADGAGAGAMSAGDTPCVPLSSAPMRRTIVVIHGEHDWHHRFPDDEVVQRRLADCAWVLRESRRSGSTPSCGGLARSARVSVIATSSTSSASPGSRVSIHPPFCSGRLGDQEGADGPSGLVAGLGWHLTRDCHRFRRARFELSLSPVREY